MASPADAIAYLASAGLDEASVWQVAAYLQTGNPPEGLTPLAQKAIQDIGPMGLSSTGVDQTLTYLRTGQPPADLSYTDESAQVLGTPTQSAPVATGGATAPAAGASMADKSARAIFQGQLDEFGLGSLGDSLWSKYLNGTPEATIFSDLRKTPEYAARFPGMANLVKGGHAISEAEYISTEKSYTQVMRAAGIPSGFYDSPDDFGKLIGGQVSPTELNQRVATYTQAAYNSPPEVRDQLSKLYGVDPGQLVAYFIDPDKALPLITNQYHSSQIAAQAQTTGYGQIDRTQAERLTQDGVTEQQAQQGFGALADSQQLFTAIDSGEQAIGQNDQLGAVFEGNSVARRKIEERRRRRVAAFEGGGAFASDKAGMGGLGTATA